MKNKQALFLLFTANTVSGIAQGLSMLAIPWYFAKQGLSEQFNYYYAIVTFLGLFWSLSAGTIVDRFSRKRVFLLTNLAEGVFLCSIAAFGMWQGDLPMVLIIAVFTMTTFGYTIHYPNLYAFAQEISPPGEYSKVISYIEIVGQSTSIAAGFLSALLLDGYAVDYRIPFADIHVAFSLPRLAIHEIFMIDGITYFLAYALITVIRYEPHRKLNVEKGAWLKRLRSGFEFLASNRRLAIFGFFSYTVFIAVLVMIFAMMPAYVHNHLHKGGDVYAVGDVMYALGALSAGLGVRLLFSRMPKPRAILFFMITAAITFWSIGSTQLLWFFFPATMMVGFCNAGIRILRVTYLMEHVPGELMGRVDSVFNVSVKVIRVLFLSFFALPFFTQSSNIRYTYLIMAIFLLVSAVVLLFNYRYIRKAVPVNV